MPRDGRARRAGIGLGWGAVATVPMTALMLGAVSTGIAPMPKPIPAALVANTLGALPKPALLGLGMLAHFAYGGGAGAGLGALAQRVTLLGGIAYSVLLWLIMGAAWLPYLGWGFFGVAQAPQVAVATLALHLIYGITLGALFAWRPGSVSSTRVAEAARD